MNILVTINGGEGAIGYLGDQLAKSGSNLSCDL
jgi:hypothetical protein